MNGFSWCLVLLNIIWSFLEHFSSEPMHKTKRLMFRLKKIVIKWISLSILILIHKKRMECHIIYKVKFLITLQFIHHYFAWHASRSQWSRNFIEKRHHSRRWQYCCYTEHVFKFVIIMEKLLSYDIGIKDRIKKKYLF